MARPLYEHYPIIAACLWCGEDLVDGAKESGWTGEGPDYMTNDGDYGCGPSPDTLADEGVGSHTPNEFTTWDKHRIRVRLDVVLEHKHEW